jgi:hypothetical protein
LNPDQGLPLVLQMPDGQTGSVMVGGAVARRR